MKGKICRGDKTAQWWRAADSIILSPVLSLFAGDDSGLFLFGYERDLPKIKKPKETNIAKANRLLLSETLLDWICVDCHTNLCEWLAYSRRYIQGIVRIISLCNRIFGDISFTFCPIKLKFFSVISTFKTNFGAKIVRFRQRYNGGLWGHYLPIVGFEWNLAPEFVYNVEMIEENLSLIGQKVKIISPNMIHTIKYKVLLQSFTCESNKISMWKKS